MEVCMEKDIIYFTEEILKNNNFNVSRVQLTGDNYDNIDIGLRKMIIKADDLRASAEQLFKSLDPKMVHFSTDIFKCTYASIILPDKKTALVCGPVLYEEISQQKLLELLNELEFPESFAEPLQEYYCNVPYLSSHAMFENIFLTLGKELYGQSTSIIFHGPDFYDKWDVPYHNYLRIPNKPFSNINIIETRYELENGLINAIAAANEDLAFDLFIKIQKSHLPQRLSNNLRDFKDYTITGNTLMRKAAEQAGVHPIHIDCYSNSLIPVIERIANESEGRLVRRQMVHGYCQLVKNYKQKKYSPLVQKIIACIDTDLCADLSLNSLSDHLGVNASYLSALFSRETGMTLTNYVNVQRVEHAKKLLLNTTLPIKTIASQCGFTDVYYFSKLFKRIVQCTPKNFRQSYILADREKLSEIQKSLP